MAGRSASRWQSRDRLGGNTETRLQMIGNGTVVQNMDYSLVISLILQRFHKIWSFDLGSHVYGWLCIVVGTTDIHILAYYYIG
jgi:hypothetical protein